MCLIEAIFVSHEGFQLIYFSIQVQRNYIHFLTSYAVLVEVILSSLKQTRATKQQRMRSDTEKGSSHKRLQVNCVPGTMILLVATVSQLIVVLNFGTCNSFCG